MDRVIGIDLGTTNTCVATVDGGVPRVITSRGGYKTTPSIVAIAEGERRLVGHLAKRQAVTNASNTVAGAKRIIGRRFADAAVQDVRDAVAYDIVPGPLGDARIRVRGREYPVPVLSAIVLAEMKRVADEFYGAPVKKAVITVPAYFTDGQRQATRDAGRIAGLDVLRIINEPTAAAVAYGFKPGPRKHVAIFDLGGGTFDVSIVNMMEGVFEVIATAGDPFLGGMDFDQRVVGWLVEEFIKEHKQDLRADHMAMQRLHDAAEKAKMELSVTTTTEISLPFLLSTPKTGALHLQRTLTREKFEGLCGDLVQKTVDLCGRLLRQISARKTDIAEVILVGGMTRMPRVQDAVRTFFGVEPAKNVHPDEVVALGAAVHGAALLAQASGGAPGPLLLDVTPHALGIVVAGGAFETIIEGNSTVPASATRTFTTTRDDQPSVRIRVQQGQSPRGADNEVLGDFELVGLPPGPAGSVEIDVQFDISADGIVAVTAKDRKTSQAKRLEMTATSQIPAEEMRAILEEEARIAAAAQSDEKMDHKMRDLIRHAREVERLLPVVRGTMTQSSAGLASVDKAQRLLDQVARAQDIKDGDELKQLTDQLERMRGVFQAVAKRAAAD